MNIKKRMVVSAICSVLVVVFLAVSLVAIFASNNLLVKTNVSVTYTAISLDHAYVATNTWRCDATEKTEILPLTHTNDATNTSSITATLTEDYTYAVIEFVIQNQDEMYEYYCQLVYTSTAPTNMDLKYCTSVNTPLEIEDIDVEDPNLGVVTVYNWRNNTVLLNNWVADPGHTIYAYVIIEIDDLAKDASFYGDFVCNISMDEYAPYTNVLYEEGVGLTGCYVELGEMPQSYASTDDTLYTITEEVYAECGTSYEVYVDANQNKYAKKDGAYYKFEPIIWDVAFSFSNNNSLVVFNKSHYGSYYKNWYVLVSRYVLFTSAWNSTLSKTSYPNSTIYANATAFYNNVLIAYDSVIQVQSQRYNGMSSSLSSLTDSGSSSISSKYWMWRKTDIDTTYAGEITETKWQAYTTQWASGSETTEISDWWLSTSRYYKDGTTETFTAGAVDGNGFTVVEKSINEVSGVRPIIMFTGL